MLTLQMYIRFQLTAMAPKGGRKRNGKGRANMTTSVINQRLSLDRDRMKGFDSELSRGLIRIYNDCGVKDKRAWDLLYDMIFLDSVMTRHFSQIQQMWPHRRSRSSPLWEWWAAFRSYMGQLCEKTRDKMNNWRWDTPRGFGDQSIAPIRGQPARRRLNAPANVSVGRVAMISGQRLSR